MDRDLEGGTPPRRMTNTEIRDARVGGPMTPGKLSMKVLKNVLDMHIKLDPHVAKLVTDAAWPEVEYRLLKLKDRIDEFLAGRNG